MKAQRQSSFGPGTVRVGQFIGRVGVVSLPAVGAALDLDERVVRRHVAKLEGAGWLIRAPWLWGEGSIAWLATAGIRGVGLDGLRAIKAPPGSTTVLHGVLVGWTAARIERRGRNWHSARELALDPDRWAVPARYEHGFITQLPDLAVWLNSRPTCIAVISEHGGRRDDRQKLILEGWRDALIAERYAGVLYDCANAAVARSIGRLAQKVGLRSPGFAATVQKTAEEIAALSAARDDHDAEADLAPRASESDATHGPPDHEQWVEPRSTQAPTPTPPAVVATPNVTEAEREQRYREILGLNDQRRRRGWRR